MIIGLDFDNTIACYDHVFSLVAKKEGFIDQNWYGTKRELKKLLLNHKDGDANWQKLQGTVYGQYMHMAKLFPGVANFLLRARYFGNRIVIVSHKTEFGHFDKEMIPLRTVAYEWMKKNKFFEPEYFGISPDDVYFKGTRLDKIKMIQNIGCHIFVDDLVEVFKEMIEPSITKKVLFDDSLENCTGIDFNSSRWIKIDEYVFGNYCLEHIENEANITLGHKIMQCNQVYGGGNSQIYKIYDGQRYLKLKKYPTIKDNVCNRIFAEVEACKFMGNAKIANVPSVVAINKDLNIAIYDWIDGISVDNIDLADIDKGISLVGRLKQLSKLPNATALPLASEACLSIHALHEQISKRIIQLKKCGDYFDLLGPYLEMELEPIWNQLLKWQRLKLPDTNYDAILKREYQTISPSDFGFHNALRMPDSSLTWIDFEYFGWDDPVKLVADFIWHPAMDLTKEQRNRWVDGCEKIFTDDPDFFDRLRMSYPFYGVRWALILLNEFLIDGWFTKEKAQIIDMDSKYDRLQSQIKKSRIILNKINTCNYDFLIYGS